MLMKRWIREAGEKQICEAVTLIYEVALLIGETASRMVKHGRRPISVTAWLATDFVRSQICLIINGYKMF